MGCGEYAGPRWPIHFADVKRLEALNDPFQGNVTRFVAALKAAGATVTIGTVYRPPPRAYLMHYAWRVGYGRESDHSARTAIDMSIKWDGDLRIHTGPLAPATAPRVVAISSAPRTGMNPLLWRVGRTYGVKKYVNADSPDPPHWSANGS